MVNETYVNWLVSWIKNGTINIKTGQLFKEEDILIQEYRDAVHAILIA